MIRGSPVNASSDRGRHIEYSDDSSIASRSKSKRLITGGVGTQNSHAWLLLLASFCFFDHEPFVNLKCSPFHLDVVGTEMASAAPIRREHSYFQTELLAIVATMYTPTCFDLPTIAF
jgi:hypothetical protein